MTTTVHTVQIDWDALVDAWRLESYRALLPQIRARTLPWLPPDDVHRLALVKLAPRHGLVGLTQAEVDWMVGCWHRLEPWPDAAAGLHRLRQGYPVGALSNGNTRLLLDRARHAGRPWDMLLGADLFRHDMPDAETRLGVCTLPALHPEQVMLCAAHEGKLPAAQDLGLATAFIQRPLEPGRQRFAGSGRSAGNAARLSRRDDRKELQLMPGVPLQVSSPEAPMDLLDLLQWPAMVITLLAAWLVASQREGRRGVGFWVFLASNALWIAWGLHTSAYALIVLQLGLALMNIRGVRRNTAVTTSPVGESGRA